MASASALAEAAISLAARGWPVFPVGRNKAPLTPRGFKDATTDPATISAIWNRLPQANIGVATGSSSGLTVIDVDGPVGDLTPVNGQAVAVVIQLVPKSVVPFNRT